MLENRCLYELAPLEIMLLLRGAAEVVTPKPTSVPLVGEAMSQVVRHSHTDVLIDGNQIVEIGQNLDSSNSRVIDVSGKVIVPGFVILILILFGLVLVNMNWSGSWRAVLIRRFWPMEVEFYGL